MANTSKQLPIVIPVSFAVLGLLALATAVLMVPVIARYAVVSGAQVPFQSLADLATGKMSVVPGAPAAQVAASRESPRKAEPGPVADSGAAPRATGDGGVDLHANAAPAGKLESPGGPWRIAIEDENATLGADATQSINAIIAALERDPGAKLRLVAINNTNLSKKRAWRTVRIVRDYLVSAGVAPYRVSTDAQQSTDATGLVVFAELAGGTP